MMAVVPSPSNAARSRMMRGVKSRHTTPEKSVRSILHKAGYRYSLHKRDLPGSPDIVFPRLKKVIFVNGCFWHSHGCRRTLRPRTHLGYWLPKLSATKLRDERNRRRLRRLGWRCLTIWECQLKRPEKVSQRLESFLASF